MEENAIKLRLVEHGTILLNSKAVQKIEFTKDINANSFLSNRLEYPHAFVLGCILDRQMRAERAWIIPYKMKQALGDFSISTLLKLDLNDIKRIMLEPHALHRFTDLMSEFIYKALAKIRDEYDCDASNIWNDKPSSATVVYRFLCFDGIGPKIANMAVNILARDFKEEFSDYYSIDISADVHVKRVFKRLGLVPENATIEQIIYRARALNPEFPGLMDFPTWEIGRKWCHSKRTECVECYMKDLCPSCSL